MLFLTIFEYMVVDSINVFYCCISGVSTDIGLPTIVTVSRVMIVKIWHKGFFQQFGEKAPGQNWEK